MTKGWYGDRQAHSLASKGIKTRRLKADGWFSNDDAEGWTEEDERLQQEQEQRLYDERRAEEEEHEREYQAELVMGIPKEQDEFDKLYKEQQKASEKKDRYFSELMDFTNPPSEARKKKLSEYIVEYYDVIKPRNQNRLLDLKFGKGV